MNPNLRIEFRAATDTKGNLFEQNCKNKYLYWLEDALTKSRDKLKKRT